MKNKILLITIGVIAIILVLVALVIFFVNKNKQKDREMVEMIEMMNFEKEQVEREYEDLTTEFDGYTSNIKNDSLIKLLEKEKLKVQQLLEELRLTKSTNARRIAELRNELATVRKVMVHYVNQIDSLNAENKVLKTENKEVKRRYQEATETVEQLSKEKENLNEVVTRASKLEITSFSMTPLNNRNRKVGIFSQIASLQFNFTIAKNITAQPGYKTVYLRIMRPDDEVLTKSPENVFHFENRNIAYSAKKDIEYQGEALSDVMYWKVEEIVQPGEYRADFFTDGYRIGSFTFTLKK
jgi:hypothetical protein